jgi:hypothetical protein
MSFLYFKNMARPRKNNAEYFSHDSGMRNDEKILALRSKFNNEGYAIWCMFLEILTNEDNFKKKIKTDIEKELLAGDLRVSVEEMENILSFCSRIELLQEKDGVFWNDNLIKRLEPMTQKREFLRQKYEEKRVSTAETPVSGAEMPQSKVKESKVNNTVAKATSITIMNETYDIEELEYVYEDTPKSKNPYGKKVMAVLARKFAELAKIPVVGNFNASEWSKPLGSMYRYFNKDPNTTMAYMEKAVRYYESKNLSYTPQTLDKNKQMMEKWLQEEDTKNFNPELYE